MALELNILQAEHGDSIGISFEFKGEIRNILIDGGPAQAFEVQQTPRALKLFLNEIKNKNQKIDLLVLTHVDDDHIGGLLAGFNKNGYLSEITQEVWFNSGKLIFNHFDKPLDDSNTIKLKNSSGSNTSIGQGIKLEEHLTNKKIWSHNLIKVGDEIDWFGCKFKILSPSLAKLEKLLVKWEKENPNANTAGTINDYQNSIEQLLADDNFEEDNSIHNGSSLAFIFECNDKSILFLGDAHPSIVIESLKSLGYSKDNPLKIDYVKVSHHGSKANTNNELLLLIECENFIISANGKHHGLPNKLALARIINRFPTTNLMFNYPDLINRIFTEEERIEATFSAVSCESPIQI
ncbi:beta-lactamase domain protein (plasmid) [Shewanella baltica OS195]|uniref:Beta-lactamase domain protein n=1 Tax=Shewanella baltica (strain OS195) TaxID=399599 RepID=A9L6D7_SHEB9|nr:MBL fold metallo-hydrolase [Shewanella baltica]ABX51719.1 beta-lactamase domain protein [Shewanella baltica OS195]